MTTDIARRIDALLGAGRALTDDASRAARRRDEWVRSHLDDGSLRAPACVVRPRSTAEVAAVVRACIDLGQPVVPYGLGSGVCGAFRPTADAVVIDLGAMTAVRALDPADLLATFEAGVRGDDAERAVAAHGLTLGHSPQSLGISTVGGWVATRSAGQGSTRYGGIERMLLGLEVVLPSGEVLVTNASPRSSTGPDLDALFLGSEGALGVITAVTLSLRRVPAARVGTSFRPASLADGLGLLAELAQRGVAAPVTRLYDPVEVARHFAAATTGEALLILLHEGDPGVIAAEVAACRAAASARSILEGDPGLAEAWRARRYEAPSFAELVASGLFFDTIEVAARWSALPGLYARVVRDVGAVPGVFAVSAHASHVYPSGASLYFTFGGRAAGGLDRPTLYDRAWRAAMEAAVDCGATIAHHHGVGRVRLPWLRRELGDAGVDALAAIRRALDPKGLMNPGALAPGEAP